MKPFLLSLISCLIVNSLWAQTVKDWYWPKGTFNKVTFYTPNTNSGIPTDATRIIYYVESGHYEKTNTGVRPKFTDYEITDIKLFKNQPGGFATKTVEFIENEVRIKKIVSNQEVENTNSRTTNFIPEQTIFKLPQMGVTANWVNNGKKYISSWAKITSNGTSIDAIKVVQYTPQWDAATIEYYVKGYGLVETLITQGKLTITILDKFHQRLFDENLYTDDLSKNNRFDFLKADNIFINPFPSSYEQTQSFFSVTEQASKKSNGEPVEYVSKSNLDNSLTLISKYEKFVINNQQPNITGVQTKYDDKDFRVILWNDKLYNKTLYNKKDLKNLGYDYIGISEDDSSHITYSYRNCEKNLILDLTEWYDVKLSIYISWFSNVVKNSSGRFIGCNER